MSDNQRLENIREMACIICANLGSEPHHLIGQGHGIMGGKADDSQTIPLCRHHHRKLHQVGVKTWEKEYGNQNYLLGKTNRWLAMKDEVI